MFAHFCKQMNMRRVGERKYLLWAGLLGGDENKLPRHKLDILIPCIFDITYPTYYGHRHLLQA